MILWIVGYVIIIINDLQVVGQCIWRVRKGTRNHSAGAGQDQVKTDRVACLNGKIEQRRGDPAAIEAHDSTYISGYCHTIYKSNLAIAVELDNPGCS
ncbi:hypothetical protein GCM10010911_52300 [Paenibacillus nasutitermitis]|uniref:Uncharacterized protein n=1 Tax=Paenibacillus nasutitermitis TaxID=1652958 RepID=A0A916ZBX9_9BACL|nr:hypothetical protein GCM10010911_52300 [Paenibacillus nasutitermitis]